MVYLAVWVVMACAVSLLADRKGRSPTGWFFYGLALWPLALAHIALARPHAVPEAAAARVPCPFCAEAVLPAARRCPHCRTDLAAGWSAALVGNRAPCPSCRGLVERPALECPHCHAALRPGWHSVQAAPAE